MKSNKQVEKSTVPVRTAATLRRIFKENNTWQNELHKKKYKKENIITKKKDVIPSWFNENIESQKDDESNIEFKSFIEEFRR